jgi:hypothetical protein
MACYISNAYGDYYCGDKRNWDDSEVPERPSPFHYWDNGWQLNLDDYKARKINKVKKQASDKIMAAYPILPDSAAGTGKQINMTKRAVALVYKLVTSGALTAADQAEVALLQSCDAWIESVRQASRTAETAIAAATNEAEVNAAVKAVGWPATAAPEWPT